MFALFGDPVRFVQATHSATCASKDGMPGS